MLPSGKKKQPWDGILLHLRGSPNLVIKGYANMENINRPKEEEGFSLSKLETKEIGNFRLHVETKMILDRLWRYFEIYLVDEDGKKSTQPIVGGVYSIGGGSRLEAPWMGLSFLRKEAHFARGGEKSKRVDLLKEGIQYELWKFLVELAPQETIFPQPQEFAPFTNESLERFRELARDVRLGEGGYMLLAKGHPHPLAGLQADPVGKFKLLVLWRKTRIGGMGFTIYLRNQDGTISQEPLVEQGLFRGNALDFYYNDILTFPVHSSPGDFNILDLYQEGLDEVFYKKLSGILTPEIRLYVTTSSKSPLAQKTDELLTRGYPPEVTPLGAVLIRAGFWGGFYDYFTYGAEGGAEGPMKLGAQKPLDPHLACLKLIERLKTFLSKDPLDLDKGDELTLYAHRQAQQVLDFLEGANL